MPESFTLHGVPVDSASKLFNLTAARSKKQPVTTISSACAEIYALAEAVRDARLTMYKAQELGNNAQPPIEVLVDNAAGISFPPYTMSIS